MNQFKHHESIKYNLSPSWPLLESLTVWISLVMILMDSVFLPSFFLSSTRSASCAMSLSVIFYQFYLWIGIWNFLPFFYFVIRNVFLLFFCYIFIFFILLLRFIVILVLFVIVASFFLLFIGFRMVHGSTSEFINLQIFDSILLLGIPLDVIIILLLRFGSDGDFPDSVLGILLDSRGPSFPDFFDRACREVSRVTMTMMKRTASALCWTHKLFDLPESALALNWMGGSLTLSPLLSSTESPLTAVNCFLSMCISP